LNFPLAKNLHLLISQTVLQFAVLKETLGIQPFWKLQNIGRFNKTVLRRQVVLNYEQSAI